MTVSRPDLPLSALASSGTSPIAQKRRGFSFRGPRPSTACARPSRLRVRCNPSLDRHEPPREAAELACHGRHSDLWLLPEPDQASKPAVEPNLGLHRVPGDIRRLAAQHLLRPRTECRAVPVVPRGLDEEPPNVTVAGLGDPSAPFFSA